ncbi:hypothetical protein ABW16_21380 [Mycolicibacter heraklionensis]|uniref:Transposase n=1 Tax=Mycolicibacter heraklionensis TaxID=512402 RepID=A0ABR5FA03_9MYCO|nr:hypothetical protein [Mycolicibacter heraklionensis]KLO25872.1 hypothetical protein ABW16_21380 [Mycolicibacter heraklionensis]
MTYPDLLTIASQVCEIDRLRLAKEHAESRVFELTIENAQLEQRIAELEDELGRSEDKRYQP